MIIVLVLSHKREIKVIPGFTDSCYTIYIACIVISGTKNK